MEKIIEYLKKNSFEIIKNVDVLGNKVELLIKNENGSKIYFTKNKEIFEKLKDKVKIIGLSEYVTRVLDEKTLLEIIKKNESAFINKKNLSSYLGLEVKIAEFLYNNPDSHIREIARKLGVHPQKIKRILDRAVDLIEIKKIEDPSLPILPHLIRLKEGVSIKEFLEKIKKNRKSVQTNKQKTMSRFGKKINNTLSRKTKLDRLSQIRLIAEFLYNNPDSHIREIARRTGLSPSVVSRRLKEISNFIVTKPLYGDFALGDINLPNLPVLVRLKEGITPEGLVRYLRFKQMLGPGRYQP